MNSGKTETFHNLERLHKGKRDGLETLLNRHLGWIQNHVRRRLGPKLRRMIDSSDVVQEAVVEFLQYGPRFLVSDENHLRALLARIVENVLRDKNDWYAARRREMALERPLPPDTVLCLDRKKGSVKTPSKSAQRHEEEAWIRLGIELLDPEDREVLVFRQWDNLSFVEIGERLNLSSGAAWMRHSRALGKLAKKVRDLRQRCLDLNLEEGQP